MNPYLKQEQEGTQKVLNTQRMPLDGDWEALEALGFIKGKTVDGLFCEVTFPEGWSMSSDESRFIDVKDTKGRQRVSIFVKETSYDRKANFSVTFRFYASKGSRDDWQEACEVIDTPTGERVAELVVGYFCTDGKCVYFKHGNDVFAFYRKAFQIRRQVQPVGVAPDSLTRITKSMFYGEFHHSDDYPDQYELIDFVEGLHKKAYQEWKAENCPGNEWDYVIGRH